MVKDDGDGTSVLSGNSIVGDAKESEKETKMLLFSGLYYKGSWGIPFQVIKLCPFICVPVIKNIFFLQTAIKIWSGEYFLFVRK